VFEFGNFFSAGGMNQFFSEAALVDMKNCGPLLIESGHNFGTR
jgi:hypothetical protein